MREKGMRILKKIDSISYAGRFHIGTFLVELPDGTRTHFYIRESRPYSIVIPVLDDGRFVMVRQYRIGADTFSIEFPMGEVQGVEYPEAAVIELKEETGYQAKRFTHIGQFYISPGWSTQVGHIYLATQLTAGEQELEPYEFIEVVHMSEAEIEQFIDQGKIMDSSTLIAFSTYKRFREKQHGNHE